MLNKQGIVLHIWGNLKYIWINNKGELASQTFYKLIIYVLTN